MAKTLRTQCLLAADLVIEAELSTTSASISVRKDEITIQMLPIELVRVARLLGVPRSKIEISQHDNRKFGVEHESIHIDFPARGARWRAVLWVKDKPQFLLDFAQEYPEDLPVIGSRRRAIGQTARCLTHNTKE